MPKAWTAIHTERRDRRAIFLLAISLLLASPVGAADVSGTWDLEIETPEGTGKPVVILTQDGNRVSGTYRGRMGEAPLEGNLSGESIQFSVKLRFRDQPVTVSYSGTVRGNEMSGSVRFGESGDGKWKARRRP